MFKELKLNSGSYTVVELNSYELDVLNKCVANENLSNGDDLLSQVVEILESNWEITHESVLPKVKVIRHLSSLVGYQLQMVSELKGADENISSISTFTYFHVYDSEYNFGLCDEAGLRQYASEQQEYLGEYGYSIYDDEEDGGAVLQTLKEINVFTAELFKVKGILKSRGFTVDTYKANSFSQLLDQVNTMMQDLDI